MLQEVQKTLSAELAELQEQKTSLEDEINALTENTDVLQKSIEQIDDLLHWLPSRRNQLLQKGDSEL